MKTWKKYSTLVCCILCVLLGEFVCFSEAQVTITTPPENRTANRGDNVNISCGYGSASALPVTWIINGTSFDQQEIVNSPLYQLNNPLSPSTLSLTVFSINCTTTFQCIVQSTPNTTTSTGGIVIVPVTITRPPENTTVCEGSKVTISCGYWSVSVLPVTWIINETSFTQHKIVNNPLYRLNNPTSPMDVSLTVFSINATTTFQCIVQSTPNTTSTRGAVTVTNELTPMMLIANVNSRSNIIVITVSWQTMTGCAAITAMYNITVMDQYSPAIVTVPANMSSVEISQFPYNGTSIVANRKYTITVSAISDQRMSYPSDSVVVGTFILQNCNVTSPSVGTIRVSCDFSHRIQIIAACVKDCSNLIMKDNGHSPLTLMGLDPGKVYVVTIHLSDGNQQVLYNKGTTTTIRVINTTSSTSSLSPPTTITPAKTSSSSTITVVMSTTASSPATPPTVTTLSSSSMSMISESTSSESTTSESTTSESITSSTSLPLPSGRNDSNSNGDSGDGDSASGGSSAGGIAGGVIGGIVVVIILIIVIIIICYFIFYKNKGKESTYDDTRNLKSPPGTGGTHASEGDTSVTAANNAQYDKVVYAAPVQAATIPHQAAASGEQYAVSTKAVNKTSEKNLPQEHVDAPDTTKDLQGVTYADLQELPSTDSGNRQLPNPNPASTYAELLM